MIHLLTVCTGNICRSPFTERMLAHELEALHPGLFTVASAGTSALVGHPMEEESAELLRGAGGNPDGFASRQLTGKILDGTDIAFALTLTHRGSIVRTSPLMLKRTFTLREAARLARAVRREGAGALPAGGSPDQVEARWRALPAALAARRGMVRAAEAADDDVVDPFRRDAAAHLAMAHQILPAVEEIVALERFFSR